MVSTRAPLNDKNSSLNPWIHETSTRVPAHSEQTLVRYEEILGSAAHISHSRSASADSENTWENQSYLNHLEKNRDYYGFLSHESPLYKHLRRVLDWLTAQLGFDQSTLKLDCVSSTSVAAYVFSKENHVVLHCGLLDKKLNFTVDEIAAVLAHELIHVKYANKTQDPNASKELDSMREFIMRVEEERVADLEALDLLNKAGFNPKALLSFFEKLCPEDQEYLTFLNKWVNSLSDEHEFAQRRTNYIRDALEETAYKNLQKPQENLQITQSDIVVEWGVVSLLSSGQEMLAIERITTFGQCVFAYIFLKHHGKTSELFWWKKLEQKLQTFYANPLPGFDADEQEIFFAMLIDDDERIVRTLSKKKKKWDYQKFIEAVPGIFPFKSLAETSSFDEFRPLKNLLFHVLPLTKNHEECSKNILNKWGNNGWLEEYARVLVLLWKDSKEGVDNRVWWTRDILTPGHAMLSALQERGIVLSPSLKISMMEILIHMYGSTVKGVTSQYFMRGLYHAPQEDVTCDKNTAYLIDQLIHHTPPSEREVIQAKEQFIIELKSFGLYTALDFESILVLSNGLSMRKRSMLLEMSYENKDKVEKFEWEKQSNGSSDERYEVWFSPIDNLLFGQYDVVWSLHTQIIQILEDIDIDSLSLARILVYFREHYSSEKTSKTLDYILSAPCGPKLQKAREYIDINEFMKAGGFNKPSQLEDLPNIPEKNHVLLQILKTKRTDKYELYLQIKDLFYIQSKQEIYQDAEKLVQSDALGTLLLSSGTEALGGAYRNLLLGEGNAVLDEALHLIWPSYQKKIGYDSLDVLKRVETINAFFFAGSLHKEELLVQDCIGWDVASAQYLLSILQIPIFRYRTGDRLFELQYHGGVNTSELITLLQSCYPEPSFYRDELISRLLLDRSTGRADIAQFEGLLYRKNILEHSGDADILHLFSIRSISRVLFLFPLDQKLEVFKKIVDTFEKDTVYKHFLTEYEKEDLLRNLFSGAANLTNDSSFQRFLKGKFLEKIYPKHIVEKISLLSTVRAELRSENNDISIQLTDDVQVSDDLRSQAYKSLDEVFTNLPLDAFLKTKAIKWTAIDMEGLEVLVRGLIPEYDLKQYSISQSPVVRLKMSYGPVIFLDNLLRKLEKDADVIMYQKSMPIMLNMFFAVLVQFSQYTASKKISAFLVQLLDEREHDMNDLVVRFLEILGVVFIKAGQYMSSLGHGSKELQSNLLRLTSKVEPINVFKIWHTLAEEYGDEKLDRLVHQLGPLVATASVRQSHRVHLTNGEERIIKIKKPETVSSIMESLKTLEKFVRYANRDANVIGWITLPEELISDIADDIQREVQTDDDIANQQYFSDKYNGKKLAGKKIIIPTADPEWSTQIVTLETLVPGKSIALNMSPETQAWVLEFMLQSISDGRYQWDPNPGNILEDAKHISMIDFGMVGTLSSESRMIFFEFLKSIHEKDFDGIKRLLIVSHLYHGWKLDALKMSTIDQELKYFIENITSYSGDFQATVMSFLNMTEGLKLKIGREVKQLVKTISQMGYIVVGQEATFEAWVKKNLFINATKSLVSNSILSKLTSKSNQWLQDCFKQADEFISNSANSSGTLEKLEFPKWTRVRDEKTGLVEETYAAIIIDPQNLASDPNFNTDYGWYMFPTGNWVNVGVAQWNPRYKVYLGGRWIALCELIFGE